MSDNLPIVLVPGLNCSARLYAEQIPALWRFGPVTVADQTARRQHRRDRPPASSPPRRRVLPSPGCRWAATSPSRSCGRRRSGSSNWRCSTPERGRKPRSRRKGGGAASNSPRPAASPKRWTCHFPLLVHRDRHGDAALKRLVRAMAEETGPEAFLRQQQAIMGRADSRPGLAAIACPTLVLVGDGDVLTPPAQAQEIVAGIPGARLVIVPECGHLSTLERPQAVTQALVEWMEVDEDRHSGAGPLASIRNDTKRPAIPLGRIRRAPG